MGQHVISLVKSFMPKGLRRKIAAYREDLFFKNIEKHKAGLHRKILKYYGALPREGLSDGERQAIDYLKRNPISVFPYPFAEKYHEESVKVQWEPRNGFPYVLFEGKPLYFKKNWDKKTVQYYYNLLQLEQDEESPHCYLTPAFNVGAGDGIADIGAAEGFFSLSVVEKVKKLTLFESDLAWIGPLKATFASWKNKVEIVHTLVSDRDGENTTTLDRYFGTPPGGINFLKIDAEGGEMEILKGAENLIAGAPDLKLALCTYHKNDDAQTYADWLKTRGIPFEFSDKYLIFYYDRNIKPPYFRRALIRANKSLKSG